MNEAQAHALYEADRLGVPQIKGQTHDNLGGRGRCALGVLMDCGLADSLQNLPVEWTLLPCPSCGKTQEDWPFFNEAQIVAHLNDHHDFTFSEIARKLGPDSA